MFYHTCFFSIKYSWLLLPTMTSKKITKSRDRHHIRVDGRRYPDMPSFPGESGLLLRNEDLIFIVAYFLPFSDKKGEQMEQQDTKAAMTQHTLLCNSITRWSVGKGQKPATVAVAWPRSRSHQKPQWHSWKPAFLRAQGSWPSKCSPPTLNRIDRCNQQNTKQQCVIFRPKSPDTWLPPCSDHSFWSSQLPCML